MKNIMSLPPLTLELCPGSACSLPTRITAQEYFRVFLLLHKKKNMLVLVLNVTVLSGFQRVFTAYLKKYHIYLSIGTPYLLWRKNVHNTG